MRAYVIDPWTETAWCAFSNVIINTRGTPAPGSSTPQHRALPGTIVCFIQPRVCCPQEKKAGDLIPTDVELSTH